MVEDGGRARLELRADCANCFGLCCAALPFARSADFAFDKPAGEPCRNLDEDFRCGIHATLRESGFKGCTVYDCFGAGQKVAQSTYGGVSWREALASTAEMFEVFPVMRALHELLWYLAEASSIELAAPLRPELSAASERIERATDLPAASLRALDVAAERAAAGPLLDRVSELVRTDARRGAPALPVGVVPNADLLGVSLAGATLRGANLRGACLIASDLSGSDLRGADVLGADLRDADVRGARLADALFLTQFQVNAAKGSAATTLPGTLDRPGHWG